MHNVFDEIQKIVEIYCLELPEPDPDWPYDIQKAMCFIHEHLCIEKFTIHDLKQNGYRNGNDFSTLFADCVGMPPKEYITYHRIKIGRIILSDGRFQNISIVSIARKLGYSGTGAFSHAIKKNEGVTPGKWRKQRLAKNKKQM